jgi:hypothetical protein
MKKIPVSTIFVLLAVPFVVVAAFMMMSKPRIPVGVPACYLDAVCDSLQILNAEKIKQLEEYHTTSLDQHDIDLRILTSNMAAAGTINYVKASKIGSNSKSGQGVLLMIDPQSALIRFYATTGLRGIYNDEFTSFLETNQMVPFFKAGKISQGIVETDKIILKRAEDAKAGKAFDARAYQAIATMLLNAENQAVPTTPIDPLRAPNIQRPTEIVSEYLRVLMMNNSSYDLPIYSQASKTFRRNHILTKDQMQSELLAHKVCDIYKEVILDEGLAAVLYDINQRHCSPYFLVFENGGWKMDIPTTVNHILIDAKQEWYLDMIRPTVYANTLLDWQFDKNGVPHPMPPMRWGLLIDSDLAARVTYVKKIYDNTTDTKIPLQEKDVILEWGGLKNPTHVDVEKSMVDSDGGQKINVLLWRQGHKITVEILAPPRT